MQIRKILALVAAIAAISLLSDNVLTAQVLETNENGDKIVVYADGSWAYYDSLDEEEQQSVIKKKKQKKKKKKRSKPDGDNDKVGKKDRKSKKSKKDDDKDKDDPYAEATERAARFEAVQRAEWAAMEEDRLKNIKKQAIYDEALLKERLSAAYTDTDVSADALDRLEADLNNQKMVVKNATEAHKEAEAYLEKCEDMIDMKKSKRDKLLAKMDAEKTTDEWADAVTEADDSVNDQSDRSAKKKKSIRQSSTAVHQDLIKNPPTPPCELAFDDIDEFTGKRRWETPKQRFFTHTSDKLKPFFKEKNHITVNGYLSGSSGNGSTYYLNLDIVILSEMAQKEFGVLEKGSILNIKLLNGDNVRLFNTKTSTGNLDKVEKTVTYKSQYMLTSSTLKALKKSEVDKARIVWGMGYEDYEVYELDFFIDQINCIESR